MFRHKRFALEARVADGGVEIGVRLGGPDEEISVTAFAKVIDDVVEMLQAFSQPLVKRAWRGNHVVWPGHVIEYFVTASQQNFLNRRRRPRMELFPKRFPYRFPIYLDLLA